MKAISSGILCCVVGSLPGAMCLKEERSHNLMRREVVINSFGLMSSHHSLDETSAALHHIVSELFSSHHEFMHHRLLTVQAAIHADFQARPEAQEGKIPAEALRPLARAYFAKEHGWIMKGLEPAGMTPDGKFEELHEVPILRHGAPTLAAWMQGQWQAKHHFTLESAATVVTALEWLTLETSLKLLDAAYVLNEYRRHDALTLRQLREVMRSYLLIFRLGYKAHLEHSPQHHQRLKKAAEAAGDASYAELESS
eukprot:TRINITY_DN41000_c0_g3_i5.p1 TRINITY_DN41000_c0_g3~~TRINITY_DN41000_c0_g3_i5.p1  ORF type:complete len:254 (+),score=80.04 TRINITY_DN41000_c0_g3_i5:96-857(+)